MSEKIGLSLFENNRIRILLNSNQAIELELRRGDNGHSPYSDDNGFVGIEITDSSEKQEIVNLATKLATKDFGVQSLFQKEKGEQIVQYESCFIDFIPEYVDKNIFLNEISFLSKLNNDLIEKIKSEKCTQIMISFPMDYPEGYIEKRLEKLKYHISGKS
ncbi:hypothetical protein [Rodentibacter trehalosifermentans]|uniref:hypothetical protein n=1 Tax=Rodentibacter trehalosifermentans TaxID=1908263 RepID=UPI000984362E|nr:hypothetical protein [Rodentibacter trehalosifermentans]OOF51616.1 hypothetical protein BKK53_07190 [Rodentibacter trehalosifermentans]